MLGLLLTNDEFIHRVLCHFPGNHGGEQQRWPKGFVSHVTDLQSQKPSTSFRRTYALPADTDTTSRFIYFGHTVYSSFVETEKYAKSQFLPLWKDPRPRRGESLTGVLDAIKARLFGVHFRDKTISTVDFEWAQAGKERGTQALLSKAGCANRAALEMKTFNDFSKHVSLDKWFPKHWAAIYYFGEPSTVLFTSW